MNTNELLTALNQQDRDGLIALNGIGTALAERILATRPFETLDQVQAVKGIHSALIQKLLDEEPASPPDPKPAPVQEADAQPEAASPLDELKDSLAEKGQAARETLADGFSELGNTFKKRGQAARQAIDALPEKWGNAERLKNPRWKPILNRLLSALLAALITLLILGGINGSLQFATASQHRSLQQDVAQLTSRAETLQQDLDGLRGRVDTLEGLGDRTVALEKVQQQLATDLENATEQVTTLSGEVSSLNEKVSQQDERTQHFETFLKDLQASLDNLFMPQGEN